jgi:hypothetical protein
MRDRFNPRNCPGRRRAVVTIAATRAVAECLESRRLLTGVTIYVDQSAHGANSGADWADAYTNLQSALTVATSGTTIDVAAGTYSPGGSATNTFTVPTGVTIDGGFANGGSVAANPVANPTVLSGHGINYHVVSVDSGTAAQPTTLDGLTITGGDADGSGSGQNDGGGIFIIAPAGADPRTMQGDVIADIVDCSIDGNYAAGNGGGIENRAYLNLTNCIINGDSADGSGGGLDQYYGEARLVNCELEGDSAAEGGGIYNSVASPNGPGTGYTYATVVNCDIVGDTATTGQGGAIALQNFSRYIYSYANISNSIIYGDGPNEVCDVRGSAEAPSPDSYDGTLINYSDIQGETGIATQNNSGHNIDSDPLFVSNYSNLQLQATSPAIDKGSVDFLAFSSGTTDLAGNPRIVAGTVDMGAYEHQYIFVDATATGLNNGTDWADAFTNLQAALNAASSGIAIEVSAGTFSPGDAATNTFNVPAGVIVEGGFANGGSATANPAANPTVLDGGGVNYHVVTLNGGASLDGFTVTGGNADGSGAGQNDGGGVLAVVSSGSSVEDRQGDYYVEINDCSISGNTAAGDGGGIENQAYLSIYDSFIDDDSAANGGGITNDGGVSSEKNCVMEGDSATDEGGAIYDAVTPAGGYYSYSNVINCDIVNDSADGGKQAGAIAVEHVGTGAAYTTGYAFLVNTIIYGDGPSEVVDVTGANKDTGFYSYNGIYSVCCDIENEKTVTADGAGDLKGGPNQAGPDPLFASDYSNLQLQSSSPCIDSGDTALFFAGEDLAGNPRDIDGTIDMGAYETAPTIWTGLGDGTNWTNAANWSGNVVPNASMAVVIPTGVTVKIGSGVESVDSITLQQNTRLDLGGGTLLINYGTGNDPIATISSYLSNGYNGGAWNGAGIISSTVASENAGQSAMIYSVGYADGADGIVSGLSSGEIEIMPTLAGDAKLQGNVDFGDFQLLSQYFGQSGTSWDEGNFTYGSETNFGDFQLLSQNFGASSTALTAGTSASLAAESSAAPVGKLARSPVASVASLDSTGIVLAGAGNDTILGSGGASLLNE